jgi:hypothetical protein
MNLLNQAPDLGHLFNRWAGGDLGAPVYSTTVTITLNRAIGFTSLLIGVASGMLLGLWSFGGPVSVPEAIGDYGNLPRRFLRLGHIAFFGLGLINLALAGHYQRLGFSRRAGRRALTLMNLGNLGLPPLLLAAAWQPGLLYLMPAPVLCVFAALALAAAAAWRTRQRIITHWQTGGSHEDS